MSNKYLGIDAGATKTQAVLYDAHGHLIFETSAGHGNILVDETVALQHIVSAMTACLTTVSSEDTLYVLVGVAGVSVSDKAQLVTTVLTTNLQGYSHHLKVVNDAYLGMMANLKGGDGLFLISGTGSVVYGQSGETMLRIGGFGHLLGDEGSAYWIGQQLFKYCTHLIDSGDIDRPIYQSLLKHIGLPKSATYELVKLFYSLDKQAIAQYAMFVSQEADQGDSDAIHFLKAAAHVLAKQVKQAIERLHFDGKIPLVVSGSVLRQNELVRSELLKDLPEVSLKDDHVSATKAVYYYWLEH